MTEYTIAGESAISSVLAGTLFDGQDVGGSGRLKNVSAAQLLTYINSNLNNAGNLLNFRNVIDGGDSTVNPWQRGTSITNIGATNTYAADRMFIVAGPGSSAQFVKVADTNVVGFSQSFKWGRGQSSGSVSTITVGQAAESLDSIRLQGQTAVFSFWARGDAGFASGMTSSTVGVQLSQGFGTDQSVSAMVNGTWTTQSNPISATQVLTSTMTRYSFSGVVSSTATQVGVLLNYTPNVTTALTAENVIMNGLQLETPGLTNFEHRDVQVELELCQRYAFVINEPASSVFVGIGTVGPTNSGQFIVNMPVQMRAAPTVTVTQGSFGALVVGGYVALTSMAASTTHTVNYIGVTGLATMVSGQAINLIGGGGATAGKITASADL